MYIFLFKGFFYSRCSPLYMWDLWKGLQTQASPDGAPATTLRGEAVRVQEMWQALQSLRVVQPAHEPPLQVLQTTPRGRLQLLLRHAGPVTFNWTTNCYLLYSSETSLLWTMMPFLWNENLIWFLHCHWAIFSVRNFTMKFIIFCFMVIQIPCGICYWFFE